MTLDLSDVAVRAFPEHESAVHHPRQGMAMPAEPGAPALQRYRPWFYAAALYNLAWGGLVVVAPQLLFYALGVPSPRDLLVWRLVGMFVLVYAPGYWWAARRPDRHAPIVLIGLLGKVIGPAGFVWAALSGQLPLAFGWTILTNDVLWWPAFALYLCDAARLGGGWPALVRGEGAPG